VSLAQFRAMLNEEVEHPGRAQRRVRDHGS